MSIRNIIRNLKMLGKAPDIIQRAENQFATGGFAQGFGQPTGISALLDVPGVSRPAENLVMVYGCLRARTEALGGIPLRLTDRNDNIIESGPVWELLNKPNARQYWRQYVRQLETYNTLYDSIVVLKVGEPGRPPDELIPLSPGYLRPVQGIHEPSGTPVAVAWEYTDPQTGAYKKFSPDQLMIHQGFNPDAPLAALSPINVLRRTMQGELAAGEQNLSLFLNDATPRGVLSSDKNITKDQADEALKRWEDKQQGYLNRNKTAILYGGLKYESTGLSPKELDFLEGLKYLRTNYYIVFRVKPAMVGEMTGETGLSQGSSTDSQKVEWWENVGLAELDLIAGLHQGMVNTEFALRQGSVQRSRNLSRNEILSRGRFIQRSGRLRPDAMAGQSEISIWFDDNAIAPLVRHRLAKIDQAVKILGQGWKPDDVNDYLDLGLPPHPDNEGRVLFSLSVIGPDAVPKDGLKNTPQDEKAASRALGMLDDLSSVITEIARADANKFKGLKQSFDKFVAPREKAAARKWSRFFIEQRDRVLKRIETTQASSRQLRRGDPAQSEIGRAAADDMMKKVFPMNDENMQLVARLAPLWSENLKDGYSFFHQEMGLDEKVNPFEVDDPFVMKVLKEREIQGLKVNNTTEDKLREIFSKGFEEGLSTIQIGDNVAEYYNTACVGEEAFRPMTAARTQVSGIVNEGRMMAANEVGGLKKGWLHGGSKEPRPEHIAAEKQYLNAPIGLDEKFIVNGLECDAPGSTELPVEEVANCSCMMVFSKA